MQWSNSAATEEDDNGGGGGGGSGGGSGDDDNDMTKLKKYCDSGYLTVPRFFLLTLELFPRTSS